MENLSTLLTRAGKLHFKTVAEKVFSTGEKNITLGRGKKKPMHSTDFYGNIKDVFDMYAEEIYIYCNAAGKVLKVDKGGWQEGATNGTFSG